MRGCLRGIVPDLRRGFDEGAGEAAQEQRLHPESRARCPAPPDPAGTARSHDVKGIGVRVSVQCVSRPPASSAALPGEASCAAPAASPPSPASAVGAGAGRQTLRPLPLPRPASPVPRFGRGGCLHAARRQHGRTDQQRAEQSRREFFNALVLSRGSRCPVLAASGSDALLGCGRRRLRSPPRACRRARRGEACSRPCGRDRWTGASCRPGRYPNRAVRRCGRG